MMSDLLKEELKREFPLLENPYEYLISGKLNIRAYSNAISNFVVRESYESGQRVFGEDGQPDPNKIMEEVEYLRDVIKVDLQNEIVQQLISLMNREGCIVKPLFIHHRGDEWIPVGAENASAVIILNERELAVGKIKCRNDDGKVVVAVHESYQVMKPEPLLLDIFDHNLLKLSEIMYLSRSGDKEFFDLWINKAVGFLELSNFDKQLYISILDHFGRIGR